MFQYLYFKIPVFTERIKNPFNGKTINISANFL